ncbi:ABC transporter ATP-binding protein [Ralstonia solanacearum]|uniref:ABC transporter ATP-binding protein n=1 Tax=Ralstonia solanacearum TaxID=305 RepID=UPI0005ACC653|nr:ABC transporter ATP-binding protein [Ralstonia solanacearum]
MARIEFRNLGHSYRPDPQTLSDYALQPMNMTWRDGGAYALLGPSGCGKSTLLNIISGLLTPSEGQVLFDGQDVTHANPRERNIAQVFQFPVIYDTMTVFDNLAFPLRNRKVPQAEVRRRVEEVAEILELQHALKRRASGLAADAKQKISLGRGLVRKDVAAILFDEPLTVIDPHLKWQLRRQLKKIHQQLKLTLIYVTHDQVEALTFADEVVVMTEGQVVQQGGPEALFERPDHTFVGYFIGSPGMNLYPVAIDGDVIALGGQRLSVGRDTLAALKAGSGPLKLGIRPEFVRLAAPGEVGTLAATVHQVQQLGTHQLLTASLGESGDLPIKAKLPNDVSVTGPRVWLRLDAPQTLYYRNDERIGR